MPVQAPSLSTRAERDLHTSRENLRLAQESGSEILIAEWQKNVAADTARVVKVLALFADLTYADSPQAEIIRRRLHEIGEDVYGSTYTAPLPTATWSICGECMRNVRNGSHLYHAHGCSRRRVA